MSNFESTGTLQTISSSCTTSENVQTDNSSRFQTTFGCLRCRPACLQFLISARWFLLFLCLAVTFEAMVVNGLVGLTISTIERRFALASSQTAWIAAAHEIVGVPALLVIGYFGSTLRRPVWIGGGIILLGIAFGIFSIPHFVAPAYRYSGEAINLCVKTAWNTSLNASLLSDDRCDFTVEFENNGRRPWSHGCSRGPRGGTRNAGNAILTFGML